jgi:hypothetical protein
MPRRPSAVGPKIAALGTAEPRFHEDVIDSGFVDWQAWSVPVTLTYRGWAD